MSKKKKLPFGIVRGPQVSNTKSVLVDTKYINESMVMVESWWNGEGFLVRIYSDKEKQSLELQWHEWTALKMAVKALMVEQRQ